MQPVRKWIGAAGPDLVSGKRKRVQGQEDIGYKKHARKNTETTLTDSAIEYGDAGDGADEHEDDKDEFDEGIEDGDILDIDGGDVLGIKGSVNDDIGENEIVLTIDDETINGSDDHVPGSDLSEDPGNDLFIGHSGYDYEPQLTDEDGDKDNEDSDSTLPHRHQSKDPSFNVVYNSTSKQASWRWLTMTL